MIFAKKFRIATSLQKATAIVAGDFCGLSLRLNKDVAATIESYQQLARIDVTNLVRRGENLIEIVGKPVEGPTAVAAVLDLEFSNGSRRLIPTDETWTAKTANVQSQSATTLGALAAELWFQIDDAIQIREVDDYTQWKQALGTESGADPASFRIAAGFEVELLRSARMDEGSWTSLTFDPLGRLVIAREDKGLLRLTLPATNGESIQVTTINDTLLECRGLLFAYNSLYANANNSKTLYRLRDTTGDDQFDEVKALYQSGGSVGHGRNDLTLGPDGLIYSIHGDAVDLPTETADRTSPFRESRQGLKTREGHVIRLDRDGQNQEVILGGLRNPFGIDFNTSGEMFTYDADAEFDMGSPWYRPTRVVHLVSGADYGWRGVTGKWPPYYPDHPDNAQSVFDIGKGSPTAIRFGTGSHFPAPYRNALFILDWAYGRILAVHMTPHGGSYRYGAETFAKGRPFNVTDLTFGPDGAMYVVTGGRKTQSGLYRIRYTGNQSKESQKTRQQERRKEFSKRAHAIRRKLEAFHGQQDSKAIDFAWPYLGHSDPSIRYAARIAIEHQPINDWQERALKLKDSTGALTLLMPLSQSAKLNALPRIVPSLNQFDFTNLTATQKLAAIRTYSNCISRMNDADAKIAKDAIKKLNGAYPDTDRRVNQDLCRLLKNAPDGEFIEKTISLLNSTSRQSEQLHYLFALRNVTDGWTLDTRREYIDKLAETHTYQGGDGLPKFRRQIKTEALATLSAKEKSALKEALGKLAASSTEEDFTELRRPFVKEWSLQDLSSVITDSESNRNFENGAAMFRAALCVRCHRIAGRGRTTGPDLTSVARRFSRSDILTSIVNPSKVVAEKYRNDRIVTTEGKVIIGRIMLQNDYRSAELKVATDPLNTAKTMTIKKSDIELHTKTEISAMPKGLLNTLNKEEILDLMAYIESGGNRAHPVWRSAK